ncbi:hypothetical protein [Streptomyces sp. NPDC005799]|uniref:hypothetical protein n=1 Tax=Streptomyces sp. NPDC005799 TaxID=3154678 RepID=UPI0033DC7100
MQGSQRRRELMRPKAAAAAVALLIALTAGCAHDAGTPRKAAATPSGYAEMQRKLAAAESALARADKDAAQDH